MRTRVIVTRARDATTRMSTARRHTSISRAFARASRVLIALALALWLPKNASAALFTKRPLDRAPTSAHASDELAALRVALRDASEATRALARAMDAALSAAAAMEGGTGGTADARAERGASEASLADGETCARDAQGACASDLVTAGAMSFGTMEDLEDRVRRATEDRVRAVLAEVASASAGSKFGASFHRVSRGSATTRVSAAHALPFRRGRQRVTEYYATGDALGDVTVRNAETGETECESKMTTSSPVLAMTAYMLSLNTSVVVTGHEDGTVAFTAIERAKSDGLGLPEHILSCSLVASITAAEANAKYKSKLRALKRSDTSSDKSALEHVGEDVPIEKLGVYRIMGRRFITAADANGRVTVFLPALNDFANVHGVFHTGSKVFAFRPYKNAVVALTQRGVTYADINAFTSKLLLCEGLLRFDIARAAFDPNSYSKLIGVTTDGRLFTGTVSLDGPRTGCSVVVGREESDSLVSASDIAFLKSYAVIARSGGLEIINVTNARVAKRVSHASNRAMLAEVGAEARTASTDQSVPIVASNGDNQIIVAEPEEGTIMIFDSNLYLAPPPALFGENPWFQPLAVMIALGVAIWSYKNKRTEALDYGSESERHRATESALRKLGYGENMARARARVTGEELDDDDEWTPAKIRQEIQAARNNGDL